jgi:copper(I)-binding protein
MSFKTSLIAGALALLPTLAAAQMVVEDPYARAASPVAISGAAFMAITNPTDTDDRVIGATTEAAERAELHTHIQTDEGIMRMVHVEEGFALPAGETIQLQRGGLHVMLLGLRDPLLQGNEIEITLEFETAEPLTVTVPVDLDREPMDHGTMDHGSMDHGTMSHGSMDHGSDN